MIKRYVLDTNVLLQNPNALFSFEDNEVIIPEIAIEELDNFKKGHKEINVNAREVARILKDLKETNSLFNGVDLENGGKLIIQAPIGEYNCIPDGWDSKKHDNDILVTCLDLMNDNIPVILVTQDIYLGIKADYLNIKNEQFETDSVKDIDQQYKGIIHLACPSDVFERYRQYHEISLDELFQVKTNGDEYIENYKFERYPNEFIILHDASDWQKTLLGRINKTTTAINYLRYDKERPYGIKPRNVTQTFMIEALMDSCEDTPLVLIKGPAGTAKTFMSLAIALERLVNFNNPDKYRQLLMCRPNQLMEDDIGYLPGTEKEKIEPLFRSSIDALSILVDSDEEHRYDNERELQGKIDELFDRKIIDTQSIGYLRGRSIEQTLILVDEAQNISTNTAKSIISRAGRGSKIIVCGDPQQIDNQYLDSRQNGISYLCEKMKYSPLCSVITTEEKDVVRSPLAKEVVKYLCKD